MVRAWRAEAQTASASLLSFTDTETALLRHLADSGSATVDELVRVARLSTPTVHDIIVRLLAMQLIDFVHSQAGFRVVLRS